MSDPSSFSGSPTFDGEEILQEFLLADVEFSGQELGVGSYSSVLELHYKGMRCAGKKIHHALYEQGVSAGPQILERFATECELLSQMRHPHIVQFLGLHFEEGAEVPILVMEFMSAALTDCIEQYGRLPTETCYSVLRDVTLGLHYLHDRSPAIIHRDLTANNVLLTSGMTAKISDLGMAKILNLSPSLMSSRMTICPGTLTYMPPEALTANPVYDTRLDSFSFGVLMIHIFCGEWPVASEYLQADPKNPGQLCPLTEIERRQKYIRLLGPDHPLLDLIRRCLANIASQRPASATILKQLCTASALHPPSFGNHVDMLNRIKSEAEEKEQLGQELEAMRNLLHEQGHKSESARFSSFCETEALREQVTGLEQVRGLLEAEVAQLRGENAGLQSSLARSQGECEDKQRLLEERLGEMESMRAEVKELKLQLENTTSAVCDDARESAEVLRELRIEAATRSEEREAVLLKLAKGRMKAALKCIMPLQPVPDFTRVYEDFFLGTADEAVEVIKKLPHVSHFSAQQLVCDMVQQSYTHCKRALLDNFRKELEELFTVDHPRHLSQPAPSQSPAAAAGGRRSVYSSGGSPDVEAMEDLTIAYGLLLRATHMQESLHYEVVSQQVYRELLERDIFHHASQSLRGQFKSHVEQGCKLAWRLLTTAPPLIVSKPLDFREDWHDREFQFWDKNPRTQLRGFKLFYTRPVLFESYGGKVGVKGWVGNKDGRRPSPTHSQRGGRGGGSSRVARTRASLSQAADT